MNIKMRVVAPVAMTMRVAKPIVNATRLIVQTKGKSIINLSQSYFLYIRYTRAVHQSQVATETLIIHILSNPT